MIFSFLIKVEIHLFFCSFPILLNLQKLSPNTRLFINFKNNINLIKLSSFNIFSNSSPIIFFIILSGYLISESNCHILFNISSSVLFDNISINKFILSSSKHTISSSFCSTPFFFFSISFCKLVTFSASVK